MKFAVAAIFKNEDPYIIEWLAFHRVVGFSHFLIADNESTDMTRSLLATLQQQGEPISLIDYPDPSGARPLLGAYEALARACPSDIYAVAFVDADEFIVPMDGARSVVPMLAERFSKPDVAGVALNWACFGSGGQKFWEDGLVIERFQKRAKKAFPANKHYKVIVRPDCIDHWKTPHHATLGQGSYVDTHGRRLTFHGRLKDSISANVVWKGMRINHYAVKSFEEFVLRKSPKGSASKAGRSKHRAYYRMHDKNRYACTAAQGFVPEVKAEIARLEGVLQLATDQARVQEAAGPTWRTWVSRLKAGLYRGL